MLVPTLLVALQMLSTTSLSVFLPCHRAIRLEGLKSQAIRWPYFLRQETCRLAGNHLIRFP